MTHTPTSPGAIDVSAVLYRAALGRGAPARYLARFQAFDARGGPRPGWHWAACASALNWLAWRGLWRETVCWGGSALLGTVAALGAAKLVLGAGPAQLWLVLALLALAASVGWGLGADALYYRVCRRRILQAVAASDSIEAACAHLERQNVGHRRWGVLLVVDAMAALALSASFIVLAPKAQQPPLADAIPMRPSQPITPPAALTISADAAAAATASPASTVETPAGAVQPPEPNRSTAVVDAMPPSQPTPARPGSWAAGLYAVQIGVFADPANAERVRLRLEAAGWPVAVDMANDKGHERVRAGPFTSAAQAQRVAERIKELGLPAFLVTLAPNKTPKAKGPVE